MVGERGLEPAGEKVVVGAPACCGEGHASSLVALAAESEGLEQRVFALDEEARGGLTLGVLGLVQRAEDDVGVAEEKAHDASLLPLDVGR